MTQHSTAPAGSAGSSDPPAWPHKHGLGGGSPATCQLVDALADGVLGGEVQGGAIHRLHLARGQALAARGRVIVSAAQPRQAQGSHALRLWRRRCSMALRAPPAAAASAPPPRWQEGNAELGGKQHNEAQRLARKHPPSASPLVDGQQVVQHRGIVGKASQVKVRVGEDGERGGLGGRAGDVCGGGAAAAHAGKHEAGEVGGHAAARCCSCIPLTHDELILFGQLVGDAE